MKKLKYKKSTEEEVKIVAKEMYPFIFLVYKQLSGLGMNGNIPSITLNTFTDFIKDSMDMIDGENINLADNDRIFITVNANKKAPLIPANSLVRYQFVEIILRLAFKRYFDSGEEFTEADALKKVHMEHLQKYQNKMMSDNAYILDFQKWREDRYYNEDVDNILKAYKPLFEHLFQTFGGSHKKPGEKHFITIDEYDSLLTEAEIVNDMLYQRDIPVHFNQSMQINLLEIENEKHMKAYYLEFLEMMCRALEDASFPPPEHEEEESDNGNGEKIEPTPATNKRVSRRQTQEFSSTIALANYTPE